MKITNKTASLGVLLIPLSLQAQTVERPNILIIQCDHFTKRVIEAYGETVGVTPVVDSLARAGVAFNNSYVGTPLSQPSRAALWTGMMPHQTNVRSNSAEPVNRPVAESISTMGEIFSAAGYEAVHFGKLHDMGALRGFDHTLIEAESFKDDHYPVNQDSFRDVVTTRNVVNYLSSHNEDSAPFICVADLINPHNICGYIGTYAGSYIDSSSVPYLKGELPPLPANFEINDWEGLPLPIQYLCCTHNRLGQAAKWSPLQYQHYIAAFQYYCKMVCKQIEEIMAALHSTPAGDNTIVVFTADHGDGMASHRMVSKQTSFYEEMTNVPFIISGAGIKRRSEHIEELSSVSLDLLPTLCGLANIEIPTQKQGINWAPMLKGEAKAKGHNYVVSEWHTEYEYAISPGRMVRSKNFKYIHYLEGNGEELYDMRNDRGEMNNLAKDRKYRKILKRHRDLLAKYIEETTDDYFSLRVEVDPRCRSHKLGYQNHEGGTARSYAEEKKWELVFSDDCVSTSWQDNWFLDGKKATVENCEQGLIFKSGECDMAVEQRRGNEEYNSNHGVLWSKKSYDDNILIKFDFMRTDTYDGKGIVLFYLLAEGYQEGGLPTDIYTWRENRDIPYMPSYYKQMSLGHISYATSLNEKIAYIRSRVYPLQDGIEFGAMEVTPSYENKGLFKANEWYSIEVKKIGDELEFIVKKDGKSYPFAWQDDRYLNLKGGRIGFRQMANRSSIYKNIEVYQRK